MPLHTKENAVDHPNLSEGASTATYGEMDDLMDVMDDVTDDVIANDVEDESEEQQSETEAGCARAQQAEGTEALNFINNSLKDSMASSGNIAAALKVMAASLRLIRTPAALESALINFGKGMHQLYIFFPCTRQFSVLTN